MSPWLTMAPLLTLAVGGLLLMTVDAFTKEKAELGFISFLLFVVAGGCSVALLMTGGSGPVPEFVSDYLATDRMSLVFDLTICAGAALTALLAGGYLQEHDIERGEFYVVLVFSAFGALVLARAADLLTVFIGLETMSLGVYCLVAFRRASPRAIEGAVKYFLLGSFAAALLLFGAALLYGATGSTSLAEIGRVVSAIAAGNPAGNPGSLPLLLLGMVLVLVGLAFKVSAVPFHMWTPDAYEGAPTPVTAFMSVAVKTAAFAVLLRFLLTCFGDELSASEATGWPPALAGLAAVTMVYGNLAALGQTNVKRMLAYSSIAHAGYILVGVVALMRERETALSAVMFYLMAYTVSNALAFGALIYVGSRGREAVTFEDLAGVGRRHPMAAIPFLIGVLSLMGFPPTAGFFAKYYVFHAAIQAGGGMVWLAVLGVLTSAIGAYYYLRVLVFLFMKEPQAGAPVAVPMRSNVYVLGALVLSGYLVMRMGLAPGVYLDMALEAAREFLA